MKKLMLITAVSSIVFATGCSTTASEQSSINSFKDYELELAARNDEITALKRKLDNNQKTTDTNTPTSTAGSEGDDLLPPNAKPGQCFARVYTPPTYKTEKEKIVKSEGFDVVEVIPAVYATEQQKVLKTQASEKLEIIPAIYGWKEERVLISPAITELKRVPAQYSIIEEKILVKPAHSIWKKGTGPITKVDQSTGEIMCLVEIPAVYKTNKKRVLKTPETTKPVIVKDAVYKTIKTKVVEKPARTVSKEIPAVYENIAVKKLVTEAKTKTTKVEPVYGTLEKRIKTSDGSLEWTPILCETNVTGDIVKQIQQSLNDKKYNAGLVDGIFGWQTTQAIKKYQKENKMIGDGQLTIALVESLNIKY